MLVEGRSILPVPTTNKQFFTVLILSLLLLATAVLSFVTWRPGEAPKGVLGGAVTEVYQALSENESIAVFLGLTQIKEEERANRIAEQAARYIAEYNGYFAQ